MGVLTSINNEIWKEKACIDDLTKEFAMHVQEGRYEIAVEKHGDVLKSLNRIQQLNGQKRLYFIASRLTQQGI